MNFKDPKYPAESVVLEFDFSSELDSVISATVTVAVVSGTDPSPAAVLDGAHQINGAVVLQRFSNGVPGVRYKFSALGVNGADKILRTGIATVRAA